MSSFASPFSYVVFVQMSSRTVHTKPQGILWLERDLHRQCSYPWVYLGDNAPKPTGHHKMTKKGFSEDALFIYTGDEHV